MSKLITRRRAVLGSLAALSGGFAFARRPDELPPTYGHLLRMGDTLTYTAHRILLPGGALAKEYDRADITSFPATGMTDPGRYLDTSLGEEYRRLHHRTFADWRLEVDGLVEKPGSFSLADLQALPARSQITRHTCEEGWTAIGEWTGVPLARLMEAVGMKPSARYVVTHSYDGWAECIDMNDVLHPQTLVAYGMNGRDLPVAHGAPVRLRVERQMGYRSMKYVRRVVATDEFNAGDPSGIVQAGWAWYTGI